MIEFDTSAFEAAMTATKNTITEALGESTLRTVGFAGAEIFCDQAKQNSLKHYKTGTLYANIIVKRLEEISVEKKCTPAQLVLAWLLAQGKDIVPIPGTKRKQRVDENLDALEVRLSSADVKRISEIAPPGAGAGLRYPGEAMKRVYL